MAAPILQRVRLPSGSDPQLQRALEQMQQNTEAALRKLGAIADGVLVEGVTLLAGTNYVAHGLNRAPKGWIVVRKDANADVYEDTGAGNSRPTTHLALLTTTPQTTVSLWVF